MKTHNPNNERIKRKYFEFLKEAKRHSESTVDAVAKAINRFETYTTYRDFKGIPFSTGRGLSRGTLLSKEVQHRGRS